ncbi:MAG: hypothetical protein AAF206_29770, partial [Bacteroidota bacterium]
MSNRRHFLKTTGLAAVGLYGFGFRSVTKKEPSLYSQQYTWTTYLKREGKNWTPEILSDVKKAGFHGLEATLETAVQGQKMLPALQQHRLGNHSL